MPADRRVYWDACVLLAYVEGEPDRADVIEEVLDVARAGTIEIVTSIISQVEVSFAASERSSGVLDDDVVAALDELWSPQSPIATVELFPMIADRSREIIRQGLPRGWTLKPMDAIHLATAQQLAVDEFQTYDDKLGRYSSDLGFPVREPAVAQLRLPGT